MSAVSTDAFLSELTSLADELDNSDQRYAAARIRRALAKIGEHGGEQVSDHGTEVLP